MKKSYGIISLTILIITITRIDCIASELVYGPYSVGFESYKTYDHSRSYLLGEDTISRPLLIHLWHPTKNQNEGQPLNFKHYIDLIAQREDYGKSPSEIDENSFNYVNAYSEFAKRNLGLDTSIQTQEILSSPVKAKCGIPIQNKDSELPLLIYAPSNSKSSVQNHMICEYLASHGFIILSVASAGSSSIRRENIGKSTMAQVKDMEYILKYCEDSLSVKYSGLGLFGFSSGGNAITLFQMRHEGVKAMLSLDGGQEYGAYMALYKMADFKLGKTNIPYCSVVNNYKDFSIYPLYNSVLSSEKYLFQMPHLNHNGFISHWSYFESCSAKPNKSQLSISYNYMSKCALGFFSKYLDTKHPPEKSSYLSGLDKEYIKTNNSNHTNIAALCNALLDNNSDLASRMIDENNENFLAEETQLNILSKMFMDTNIEHAIHLGQINVENHPNSWQLHYDLGFMYMKKGESVLARKAILKAKELNPGNTDIANLLDEINQID